MKKLWKLVGIIALIVAIGFSIAACSNNGDGGGETPASIYTWTDSDSNNYELIITEAGRAVTSGNYTLTITLKAGGTKTSTGTASGSAGSITLTPSSGSAIAITINVNTLTITGAVDGFTLGGGTVTIEETSISSNTTIGGDRIRLTGLPIELNGCTQTDFSYFGGGDPISNIITGSASVKINGGKLNISLDVPKTLVNFSLTDITVNPTDTKYIDISFCTSNDQYHLECVKFEKDGYITGIVSLYYMDRDATVDGTYLGSNVTYKWDNVKLYKGWNYVVMSHTSNNYTYSATRTLPSGFKWAVRKNEGPTVGGG